MWLDRGGIAEQVAGACAERDGGVLWVVDRTTLEAEAAAADALVELVTQRGELFDVVVESLFPVGGDP